MIKTSFVSLLVYRCRLLRIYLEIVNLTRGSYDFYINQKNKNKTKYFPAPKNKPQRTHKAKQKPQNKNAQLHIFTHIQLLVKHELETFIYMCLYFLLQNWDMVILHMSIVKISENKTKQKQNKNKQTKNPHTVTH